MNLLKERKVDMVLAHVPPSERRALVDGWATGRQLIGSNAFWIVVPANDPAKIADAKQQFRHGDAGKEQCLGRLCIKSVTDRRMRLGLHRLGDNIGVQQDHQMRIGSAGLASETCSSASRADFELIES